MLLLIAGIVTGQAASYNIWVCGVQVNDTNKDDIGAAISSTQGTVTGKVTYDPSTKTLTLTSAKITTSKDHGIRIKLTGVTVKLMGTTTITTTASGKRAIRYDASGLTGTIQGSGLMNKVTLKGTTSAIYIDDNCSITLQNLNADCTGTSWGICGHNGTSSEWLFIKGNSNITAEATAANGEGMGDLDYIGLSDDLNYYLPQRGSLDGSKHCVVDYDGNIAPKVTILKESSLHILVGGITMTNCNYQFIGQLLKDEGKIYSDPSSVKYNRDNNTITINKVTYDSDQPFVYVIQTAMNLNIKVAGTNNTLYCRSGYYATIDNEYGGINIEGATTDHTANTLVISGPTWGILVKHLLTLKNLTLVTSAPVPIACNMVESQLTLDKCKMTAASYSTTTQEADCAFKGFQDVTLTNVDVKTPGVCFLPDKGGFGYPSTNTLVKTVEFDVPTAYYKVKVLGHQITDVNPAQFGVKGKTGTCAWDQSTKTLTLGYDFDSGCTITSDADDVYGIYIWEPDAKIVLKGKNTIETAYTALGVGASGISIKTTEAQTQETRFKSTNSSAVGILENYRLNFSSADKPIYVEGKYAFSFGNNSSLSISNEGSNSFLYMKGSNSWYSGTPLVFTTNTDFWYDNTTNTTPGCYWKDLYNFDCRIFQNGGEEVTNKWIAFAPVTQRYGLFILDTEINDANRNAVGDSHIREGIVSYKPSTKTLTLDGARITATTEEKNILRNEGVDGLTINVTQDSRLINNQYNVKEPKNAIISLLKNTTIKGNGTLEIDGDPTNTTTRHKYIHTAADLTLKDINMTINRYGWIYFQFPDEDLDGYPDDNGTRGNLIIDLTTKGKRIKTGRIVGFNSLILRNGGIIYPYYAYWDARSRVVRDYSDGEVCTEVTFADEETYATGIDEIEASDGQHSTDNIQAIYDLTGRRQPAQQRGLNIIRKSDGTTTKVMVK